VKKRFLTVIHFAKNNINLMYVLNANFEDCMYKKNDTPEFNFHITEKSRKKYNFDEPLFSIKGDVIFSDFKKLHRFVNDFNNHRMKPLPAGEFNAMGILDEVYHFMIEQYRLKQNANLFAKMEKQLIAWLGKEKFDKLLLTFSEKFPVSKVYQKKISAAEYLQGSDAGLPNRHIVLEELVVLWLENRNPAFQPITELIDENEMQPQNLYRQFFSAIRKFFDQQESYAKQGYSLLEFLQLPAQKFPNSIFSQLTFIKVEWAKYIQPILSKILMSIDYIKEEQKARFDAAQFGPGPTHVASFEEEGEEPEQFSPDLHWMPQVTLIAKSTYVWLDQLSKTYKREIKTLDQIPNEELERLSRFGFTGLWLIGLWERSAASQKIKQINGNPEAVASAYSLKGYDIAKDLGGDEAWQNFRDRAWQYGIRLASDMVPNHMGIDSDWVIKHPHWFIQSNEPPFPSYTFNGQNLSDDERVGIYIEDGYWNRSDAAVVFKRVDHFTGDTRYIYHGNDGTSMPWNDTAQLNYLMAEVREAVIQTILHVARKFPIIRFDAAMTLAKKHYQRLWFPEPGSGGDIPSRAEHAKTKPEFNEVFPEEFWRMVVDRTAAEAPETLLLAEAFWMMEGYFVRSLGMHRVYNSAFMNMLKNEENEKYRKSIKNVLEFNPQILKRYVNFMNNPDEETAVEQFGKEDKYFGVCILLSTMPGLPMFGHGQIEGYREKYGMEYKRAYWDEYPDNQLIERHHKEIAPLLKKRYIFSEVDHFFLYDFFDGNGWVNENVFAYSNRYNHEASLVVYQNKFASTAGWIYNSVAYRESESLKQKPLLDALGFETSEETYLCFRDIIQNEEYIRSTKELAERGLFIHLGAFKYHVFCDFRICTHTQDKPYADLARHLTGKPVESIERYLKKWRYRDILTPFWELVNKGSYHWISGIWETNKLDRSRYGAYLSKREALVASITSFEKIDIPTITSLKKMDRQFKNLMKFKTNFPLKKSVQKNRLCQNFSGDLTAINRLLFINFIYILLKYLYRPVLAGREDNEIVNDRSFDLVLLEEFAESPKDKSQIAYELDLCNIISDMDFKSTTFGKKSPSLFFEILMGNKKVQKFLLFNRYKDVVYFNKERFEDLMNWLAIFHLADINPPKKDFEKRLINHLKRVDIYLKSAEKNGYEVEKFIERCGE
jgi:glycosidase